MKRINVMIIDDSALVRQTLTKILNSDPGINVIATAADPIFAARKMVNISPDVLTLDLEMPRMNGLTFLKKIMSQYPLPVVIISSLTDGAAELSMKAMELGAVDVIAKPKLATKEFFEESKIMICDAVKGAAATKKVTRSLRAVNPKTDSKLSAEDILSLRQNPIHLQETTDKIIAVGASTGGTTAIANFLQSMPPDCPGIVIVQHMPELFTKSFAERLDGLCAIKVKEGIQGDSITRGKAIIAPGNKHMQVNKSGAKYFIDIREGSFVNRHRPSVDVLFRSVAQYAGRNAVGILLTGMGDDGAKGLLEMKQAGAYTVAQDEKSSVVFGMPKVAIEIGAVCDVLHLNRIARKVINKLSL